MKTLSYHLRIKRVSGLNLDNTPKIEDILVKLVGLLGLQKYCRALVVRGYVKTDPPKIEAVLERLKDKNGKLSWDELGEDDVKEAQKIVDDILNVSKQKAPIDYKAENEKLKKRSDDLEQRLNALENKPKPGRKAQVKEEPKQQSNE